MSEAEQLETVKRVYEAFTTGNLPALLELMTVDVEMIPPIFSGETSVIGWGQTWHGRDGVTRYLATIGSELEFEVFQPDAFIVGSENVVVQGHERCRVRSTGRVVDANWVQIFSLRDGKVSRHREYSDTAAWEAGYAT
jgi:ketosteroid isomerase-like protein